MDDHHPPEKRVHSVDASGQAGRKALPRTTMLARSLPANHAQLIDPFGRQVRYLRVSVTDRCDFRCVYCMSEAMTFLPKADLLTLEELDQVCSAFVRLGVRKLRITGGEPLVRRDVLSLFRRLGRHLDRGALDELTLTTNASRLAEFARPLADCGVRRVNISLDTLDPVRFRAITRTGELARVLAGIDAAQKASLAVKINVVAMRGINDDEIPALLHWCASRGFDMTLIEVMPMGEIGESRLDHYLPLSELEASLAQQFTLTPLAWQSGGPARYVRVEELAVRLGLITPLTHTFCESCNRVRLTCTGRLYLCLGQPDSADLRAVLRGEGCGEPLEQAVRHAITRKPRGHDFHIDREQKTARVVSRHMSVTGG